jgi:hypothetical protein
MIGPQSTPLRANRPSRSRVEVMPENRPELSARGELRATLHVTLHATLHVTLHVTLNVRRITKRQVQRHRFFRQSTHYLHATIIAFE